VDPENPTSQDPPKDQEFHSYRRALVIGYVGALGLAAAWVVLSIVVELFFGHGRRVRAPEPTPADLLACNHDVRGLFEDPGKTAAELQAAAVVGDARDLDARWEEFSRHLWQERWEQVLRRCKFDELAETGLGPAYDRMARVHRELPAMMLEYREMMRRFTREQARELDAMRHALDKSRKLLEERAGTPPRAKD